MRKRLAQVLSILAFLVSTTVVAHGGHEQTMGTVAAIDAKHIQVKTRDGTTISIQPTPDTKYVKRQSEATFADVAVGTRIIVESTKAKDQLVAAEVQLGNAAHAKKDQP